MPQGDQHTPTPAKPRVAIPVQVTGIPSELKKIPRWVLWKYVYRKKPNTPGPGKWTKVPFDVASGKATNATDTANGTTFVAAVQALRAGRFDGLGFILGDGIAGIDVDDCIDAEGNIDLRGQRMSSAYEDTYAEVSPSGTGFKILVKIGDDPKLAVIGKNTGDMEIYGGKRYFTVTGARLPEHAPVIAELPAVFAKTATQMGAMRTDVAPMPQERAKETIGIDMKAARELLDHLPFSWCDLYHDWLRAGMALHHEFDGDEEALELWDEWSKRAADKYDEGACELKWKTFGKPGKDEVTMRTLVRDAQATGWRAPRTIARAIEDFSPFDDNDDDPVEPGATRLDWWAKNSIGPLLDHPAKPKQWVWTGVLRVGKVLVLAGSGGSSKSYLMLGACVQYALGNDWGPFTVPEDITPGRVLLMYGEEDREDVHDRTQALKHCFMLTDEQVNTVRDRLAVLPLRGQNIELARVEHQSNEVIMTEQLNRLEARIKQYGVRLLVMDPMALLHHLDENDNRSIAAFIAGLDAVCMRNACSIILVHHFGKGGPMKAREINESNVRGASALAAHARTVVVMHRLREDEAAEWGVPEEDHARWVMWAIAKNNYGPTGRRAWFNVDEHTGAITPAPAELTYRDAATLRAEVNAARQENEMEEITRREEHVARTTALEEVHMVNRMRVLLRDSQRKGKLATIARALDILLAAGMDCTPRRARATVERIRMEELVDTDGHLTIAGERWLEERAMLE